MPTAWAMRAAREDQVPWWVPFVDRPTGQGRNGADRLDRGSRRRSHRDSARFSREHPDLIGVVTFGAGRCRRRFDHRAIIRDPPSTRTYIRADSMNLFATAATPCRRHGGRVPPDRAGILGALRGVRTRQHVTEPGCRRTEHGGGVASLNPYLDARFVSCGSRHPRGQPTSGVRG